MRPKFTNPGLGLTALAASILLAGGCSNDSSVTTSIQPGSATDPGFLLVQDQINNYLDSVDVTYSTAFSKLNPEHVDPHAPEQRPYEPESPIDGAISKIHVGNEVPVYNEGYSDGWHWTEYAHYYDTYSFLYYDSVKFMNDGART